MVFMRFFTRNRIKLNSSLMLLVMVIVMAANAYAEKNGTNETMKFNFGTNKANGGYIPVSDNTFYTEELGYGFEPGSVVESVNRSGWGKMKNDFITSSKPFFFSVKLPEGNYKVTLVLGDREKGSDTTVKAELRRLMLDRVLTKPGKFVTCDIIVNVRTPDLPGGKKVNLLDREKTNEVIAWDDKLTLEFNGSRPCISSLEIKRIDDIPTIYILGDSTVCDQLSEPWTSWGQMLTNYFKPELAIANHAESGESIRSSMEAGRFDKVWSLIKKGDYLLVQYGHNDQKSKDENALSIYRADLFNIVKTTRELGATPVLITSIERKAGVTKDTLGEYPQIVRDVARETGAAMIDLHAKSKVLYKALGEDIGKAFQDGTHHNAYGSSQFAQCVVQGLIENKLGLSKSVVDGFDGYDPSNPDSAYAFFVPVTPRISFQKPLGD